MAALLVLVALALTAAATARDLFRVWPEQFADAHPLNREIAAVARFLEHDADGRPVVISSRDIEDEDPYVVSVSLDRAIERRWVDSSQALALPAGAEEAWLIVTADRWIDPVLADVVSLSAGEAWGAGEQGGGGAGEKTTARLLPRPVGEGEGEGLATAGLLPRPVGEGGGEGLTSQWFSLHLLTAANWPVLPTPAVSLPPESSFAPAYPVPFCACEAGAAAEAALWLTGVEVDWPIQPSPNPSQGEGDVPSPDTSQGEGEREVVLLTSWETGAARFLSLAMFVHLLDAAGNIVAQDDGLGYPPHTWQPGDRFLQVARLPLPAGLPPGAYTLQFGLYDRATGARWPVLNADGQPAGDRVLLMGQWLPNGNEFSGH